MSYKEMMVHREELIIKADKISSEYISIAYELLASKSSDFTQFSHILHEEIESWGVMFEFYYDGYDYSRGRGSYTVKAADIDKYIRRTRIEKIQKLIKDKNTIVQK